MKNKNLRRLRCLVTAQTRGNLERLAQMDGCGDVGRMVDKLTRDKMIPLKDGAPPPVCRRAMGGPLCGPG